MFVFHVCKCLNYFRKYKGKLRCGRSVTIHVEESSFEGANSVGSNSTIKGNWGYGSYCGNNCHLQGNVGRFCSFGSNCKTIFWSHPTTYPFVSTSPIFYSLRKQCGSTFADSQKFNEINTPPIFGNDIWVGSDVTFIGSIKIGDGAIILTGAVVTKDVLPYQIVGGIPAKPIGFRYNKKDCEFLIQSKWWSYPIEWFKENWNIFNDFNEFKRYITRDLEKNADR